jgi:hypothetical protein
MPGIGIRVGQPIHRSLGTAELSTNTVNTTVPDAIGMATFTIPYVTLTGNILVRMVGRCNTATRPLTIQAKIGPVAMVQKALYAGSGAGAVFIAMWTLTGVSIGKQAVISFPCVPNEAGCAAIRVGELGGAPSVIAGGASAGYSMPYTLAPGNALLCVGGCTDSTAAPFSSPDFSDQFLAQIPPQTSLPNRHNGLSAYFGVTYELSDPYDIVPSTDIAGAIGVVDIKPGGLATERGNDLVEHL